MAILLLDDEEWTVSKLREVLRPYEQPVFDRKPDRTLEQTYKPVRIEYVSTLADALYTLVHNIVPKRKGRIRNRFTGIVTDFHMGNSEEGDLDGKQVLRLLRGIYGGFSVLEDRLRFSQIESVEPEIAEVIRSEFENMRQYRNLLRSLSRSHFVLFSSCLYGDGSPDAILEDVHVTAKNNDDPHDLGGERSLEHYFLDAGVLKPLTPEHHETREH
jgi:hypothetical protein